MAFVAFARLTRKLITVMVAAATILVGVLVGYGIVTMAESLLHKNIHHASARARRVWKQIPVLGPALHRAWYSHHMIHHCRTFSRDHVTQFASPEEREDLTAALRRDGYGWVESQSFGARVGPPVEFFRYVLPVLPVYVALFLVSGPLMIVGAIVPLALWPSMAEWVHPYLHMPRVRARESSRGLMKLVLRSRYFEQLVVHHWLHHRYVDCNFNLLFGGDRMLGRHRAPSDEDRAEMRRLGLIV